MTPIVPSHATVLLVLLLVSLLLHDAKAEWVETAKLTDSDDGPHDHFGWDVAIDNGILVAGAPYDVIGDNYDIPGAGSVTVFELSDGEWVAEQKLRASDAQAGAWFGYVVAIQDGTLAVGAPEEDIGGNETGAVYIYGRGAGMSWTEQQKLIPSDAAARGRHFFGWSLASKGNTLIIGARAAAAEERGAVYVYTLLAGIWSHTARLTARDGSMHDQFGWAVAINADAETIVVGASYDDDLADRSGSAYVFQRAGEESPWTQKAKLTPAELEVQGGDHFGQAVAIEGDTVWVGSRNSVDGARDNAGAVYQFGKEADSWTQRNKLVPSDFAPGALFGFRLAVRHDTLVVGARGQDGETGAVYLFQNLAERAWTERAKLVASDGDTGDSFGRAVAVDDGMVIAGADGHADRGWVYAFELSGEPPSVAPIRFRFCKARPPVPCARRAFCVLFGLFCSSNGSEGVD